RTAAHTRALRHVTEDESLTHAIDRVWETWALDPLKLSLVDLTEVALPEQVGLRRQTERDVERIARLRLTNARLRARLRGELSVRRALGALRRDVKSLARAVGARAARRS